MQFPGKKKKNNNYRKMDLNYYFEPVALEKPEEPVVFSNAMFGRNIYINTPSTPINEISNYQIAIIGIPEETRTPNKGTTHAPDKIREKLYSLYKINDKLKIIDLGNLKSSSSVSDTYYGVRDVLLELLNNQVIAVVLGGSKDLTYGIFMAFEQLKNRINLVTIDSRIDAGNDDNFAEEYLQEIWKSSKLFRFTNLGYQQYLVNPQMIEKTDTMGFEAIRLGVLRNNITIAEPILRDAQIVSFDISSVRQCDAPGTLFSSPNGFYAEESCQLARYAGLSDKVSCFGIYEVNPEKDKNNQTAHLAAQMIWYFIEGFSQRKIETPSSTNNDYKVFIIKHEDMEHEMTFYKSQITNRWWMEVPDIKTGKAFLIACSQEEYQQASNHDIPELWWRTFQRIN
jgi:arginase family enzyme